MLKAFHTTRLIRHLLEYHAKEYEKLVQATSVMFMREQHCLNTETLKKREKFPPDSEKAKLITEKIVKFIMDGPPFSMVENVVFQLLIEHLKPRYTLPNQQETDGPHLFTVVSGFLSKHLGNVAEVDLKHDSRDITVCVLQKATIQAKRVLLLTSCHHF